MGKGQIEFQVIIGNQILKLMVFEQNEERKRRQKNKKKKREEEKGEEKRRQRYEKGKMKGKNRKRVKK